MRSRLRRIGVVILTACAVLCAAKRAEAGPNCSITVTGVAFGVYDVFSVTPTDSTGTVTFRCTGNAGSILIALTKGASTTFDPRTLTSGADSLNYNLFTDAARSTIWGDGTGTTGTFTLTYTNADPPNGQPVVLTMYGRIAAGQDVSAGSYADTVTATINF